MIADAAIQYLKAKKGPFTKAPIGKIIKSDIPKALQNKLPLEGYAVKGSIGAGRFASIPWIVIRDNKVTSSTKEGVYIAFLFSSDGKRVYLTLNQGTTYFKEKHYEQSKIKDISNEIYERFPSSTASKMNIDLFSDTDLGKGYEPTTVSAFEYDTSNMPAEDQLLSDVHSLLDDYSKIKQFFIDNDMDLEKFYSEIMGNDTSNKYKEFKYLLKCFVEQGNINIQDKVNRKPGLDKTGFENNNFNRFRDFDIITIDDIEYHIHLFNNSSYGPAKGNGSGKVPYIDYRLANGNWANIRVTFHNAKMNSLRIVEWNENSGDKESGISYMIDDLDLFSNAVPNYNLKKLYKEFSLLEGEEKSMMVNDKINELADKLKKSKNIILRGAPGTGKTYLARQIAASLIGEDEDKLNESEQYGFVQFHPSYDYTDFVEGLRPVTGDEQKQVSFKLVDGIFKEFCERAKKSGLEPLIEGETVSNEKKYVFVIDEINRGEISKIFGELFFSIDPGYR